MMNRNRRPIPRFFNIESQIIIDTIIKKKYYPVSLKKVLKKNIKQASKSKINFKDTLAHDLSPDIFYVQEGDLRNQTLFYEFIYGHESKIAGTGLRESHFESASKYFETIFRDIYPGGPLNFHEINLEEFCSEIFKDNISNYKEVLPIRLASYFYPKQLLPIFRIDHLKQICNSFGFTSNAETKGTKLFDYNFFLKNIMRKVKGGNTIKMYICSQVHYTIDLRNRINSGECYDDILNNCRKKWIRSFFEKGMEIFNKFKSCIGCILSSAIHRIFKIHIAALSVISNQQTTKISIALWAVWVSFFPLIPPCAIGCYFLLFLFA